MLQQESSPYSSLCSFSILGDRGNIILEKKNFNRWTFLEEAPNNKHGHKMWKCECECGKIKTVTATQVRRGRSKSCGCLQRNWAVGHHLPRGEAERNRKIRHYKRCAKEKGLEYSLGLDDFILLTAANCFYCGTLPTPYFYDGKAHGAFIGNGIDRVDNTRGYTKENVVPCCTQCNWAKNVQSKEEFYAWALRFYNYNKENF